MYIEIKRNTSVLVYAKPDKSSQLEQKLMGDDVVKLTFIDSTYTAFQIGDFIEIDSRIYKLNRVPGVHKVANNHYKYTCEFEGAHYDLAKVQFQLYGLPDFDYTGTASDFLNLAVSNLNRVFTGYTAGTVAASDAKTMTFDKETVLQAINRICEEFEIEFSLVNKVLHFQGSGVETTYEFTVGRYQGLYDLLRKNVDSANITTRLWAYGSEKNIPPDYRSGSRRLIFANPALSYESRVENNVSTYGLSEATQVFEDIYPTRTGEITAVNAGNIREFTDTSMDFDLNSYKLSGLKPKVNFKSGNLAGLTFDISYNHATKTFTLDYFSDAGVTYPNASLKPAIGDDYVILDISLPQSYVDTAETALKAKADAWIAKYSVPNVLYQLNIDPMYIRDNSITLKVGDYVKIIDSEFNVNAFIRINALTRNLIDVAIYTVDIGETLATPFMKRVSTSLKSAAIDITKANKKKAAINEVYTKEEVDDKIVTATEFHGSDAKTTPADADEFPFTDSEDAWETKIITWNNIKGSLEAYFNGIYSGLTSDPEFDTVTIGPSGGAQSVLDIYNDGLRSSLSKLYIGSYLLQQPAAGLLALNGALNITDSLSVSGAASAASLVVTNGITGASIDVSGEVEGGSLDILGNAAIAGTLTVSGDIIQNGSSYETHAEHLYTAQDYIISRDGAIAGLGVGEYSGVKILLADGTHNLIFGADKDGWGRIGWEGDTMQKIATLTETIADNTLIQYNNTTNYFYGSNTLLNTLTVNGLYVDYSSTHKIYLNPNGNSYLIGGKLGIGTDSPGVTLDLKSADYRIIKIDRTENASINNVYYIGSSYSTVTDSMWLGISSSHLVLTEDSRVGIGTQAPATTLDVSGTGRFTSHVYFGGNIGTNPAVSGIGGSGWQIDSTGAAFMKSLTIREALNVYELNINKIRSGNGSYWFSDGGKILISYPTWSSIYGMIFFDDDADCSFSVGDIVREQKWTGRGVSFFEGQVYTTGTYTNPGHAMDGKPYISIYRTTYPYSGTFPSANDEIVRVGSATTTSRQGAIYITSNDDDSPYMDVVVGKTSIGGDFTTKVRVGKLDGITDTTAGLDGTQSDEWGAYLPNLYASGHIYSTSGEISGFTLSGNRLSKSSLYIFSNNTDATSIGAWNGTPSGWPTIAMYKDYSAHTDRVILNMGETYSAAWTGRFGFSLTPSKASNAYFEFSRDMSDGTLTAKIAGWNFDTTSFSNTTGNNIATIQSVSNSVAGSIRLYNTSNKIMAGIGLAYYSSAWQNEFGFYLCADYTSTPYIQFTKNLTSGTLTAKIASWNFNATYLYTGTLQTSDAYTSSGITIGNGAIRSKYFRVDTDGSVYANNLYIETANGVLLDTEAELLDGKNVSRSVLTPDDDTYHETTTLAESTWETIHDFSVYIMPDEEYLNVSAAAELYFNESISSSYNKAAYMRIGVAEHTAYTTLGTTAWSTGTTFSTTTAGRQFYMNPIYDVIDVSSFQGKLVRVTIQVKWYTSSTVGLQSLKTKSFYAGLGKALFKDAIEGTTTTPQVIS